MSSLRQKATPITLFVLSQVASVAVLTLWIVWWALDLTFSNVMWLLQGIFLMVWVITTSSIIFGYWGKVHALDVERVNFLSSVSHELLTPVAAMKLYIETMQMRELSREQQLEFLGEMAGESERLEALIRQILVASRIERRRENYHFEPKDLKAEVEDFLADNPKLVKDISLHTELAEDCLVRLDSTSMHIVLRNLVANAVRYSPDKAQVTITVRAEGKNVLLAVKDQGQGIPKEELKKIFKLFYRATKVTGGTGLGLYIVKNIVAAHHGMVWAESDGVGLGSTMYVRLPRHSKNC